VINWSRTSSEFNVNKENVKVRDKIYAVCSKCNVERSINYRTYKRVTRNGSSYKCSKCSRIENGKALAALGTKLDSKELSNNSKNLWKDPTYRRRISDSVKATMSTRSNELSIRSRENTAQLWSSSWYREKVISRLHSDEVRGRIRVGLKRAFESDRLKKRISNNMKNLWMDSSYRNKITKSSIISLRQQTRCSSIQLILYSMLDDLGVMYYREYKDKPVDKECCIGPYTCDCVIPVANGPDLVIECQGDWIHSRSETICRDKQKVSYFENHLLDRYRLKFLWEHEFKCYQKVLEKLRYWLGLAKYRLIKFNFSDVVICRCKGKECNLLLSKYHYLSNSGRSGISFGAYLEGKLVAVCIFSPLIRQNIKVGSCDSSQIRELSRLCIDPRYQMKNFASWFVSRCVRLLPKRFKIVISYCDTTFNHQGTVYKACGFELDREVKPDYWYVDDRGWVMHKKTLYNHAVKNHMTEKQFSVEYKYKKVFGSKKLRFIKYLNGGV
jgi:hypothetical protein